MTEEELTKTIRQFPKPDQLPWWPEFYSFVRTNLGDVPVLDDGRFISEKIRCYWLIWNFLKNFDLLNVTAKFEHFQMLIDLYIVMHMPPTRIELARLAKLYNCWRILGGEVEIVKG